MPDNIFTQKHSEAMENVITAVPPWLLRWGITLFFLLLVLMGFLTIFIHYPDIVKTQLKIESQNTAKPIVTKFSGKIIKILARENDLVKEGQVLAYMESTGNHEKILGLIRRLKNIQQSLLKNIQIENREFSEDATDLGELQGSYQVFYQTYLDFKSTVANGVLLNKQGFLKKDLSDIAKKQVQLKQTKLIQQRSLSLANDEYEMHKKLATQKVETVSELRQQEAKFLIQKTPLLQTEAALLALDNDYTNKQKEIQELLTQIDNEKAKFNQAVSRMISEGEEWRNKYILQAPQSGKLGFSGIVQVNQFVKEGQEAFYITTENEAYFGEMLIPQDNMGKVKIGQSVLIKLKSYPFEEYGVIWGKIQSLSDVPIKDSTFTAIVKIKIMANNKRAIHLKEGMRADAEIVTKDATILDRLRRSLFKVVDYR